MTRTERAATPPSTEKRIAIFCLIGIGYLVYLAIALTLLGRIHVSASSPIASPPDVACALLRDALLCSAYPLAAFAFAKRRLSLPVISSADSRRSRKHLLILTFGLLFFLFIYVAFGPKNLDGLYRWLRYLIFVAFSEELLFRGIVFWGIYSTLRQSPRATVAACVVSGALWRAGHGIAPFIMLGEGLQAFSHVGGGIVVGSIFALIMVKTKSLAIPVVAHACMDSLSFI